MITLLLLATVVAQDTARLTLDLVVRRALASYPTVAAARALQDRAAADLGEANSSRLPRLSLDAALNRFQEPNVVRPLHGFDPRNPPLFDRTLLQSGVSLNWTVFDFGNRASRVRAQRALGGAAGAAVSAAEQQIIARATTAYLRVLSAREVLIAEDQRLAALASAADRMRRLLAEGKAARVEGLRVEVESKRAEADRIGGASQLDVAEHELAQLAQVGYTAVRETDLARVRLTDTAAVDSTETFRTAVVTRARSSSPEIQEAEQRVRAAQAGIAAARATWFPELRVLGAWVDRGRWWGDFQAEWQVGVALSYPLYAGGARTSAVRRASADDRAAREQLRAAQLNVERSVDRSLAALREAHARVAALQTAVEQSAELARIERLAFDVGSGTQTDYLEAEASLFRARASLIEARHAEISTRVELARITGELTPEWLARTVESAP